MKLTIDTQAKTLTHVTHDATETIPLYSSRAFDLMTHEWLRVGWNQKYSYQFTWMGLPCIQMPEDMIRTQEVIARLQPDVIVETGVAHGGSVLFYASLCKILGHGRVIGIDIEFRDDHRQNVESHPLAEYITLIEGSSVDPSIVARVKSLIKKGESVMVLLDSNHTKQHVFEELQAYGALVSVGSYIVATDGCMEYLCDVPRGAAEWKDDNPCAAARDFLAQHPEFILETPRPIFSESELTTDVTHWPNAWLKRLR